MHPRTRCDRAHLVKGEAVGNGQTLVAGDALMYADEPLVSIEGGTQAEVLVFDLARLD